MILKTIAGRAARAFRASPAEALTGPDASSIPAGEHCYCGRDDWKRQRGRACTVICCTTCGYVADITVDESA